MEPIISPWIFYLLGFIDDVNVVCAIAIVAEAIVAAIVFMALIFSEGDTWEWTKKAIKPFLFISIPTILIGLFVPTSETVYKMIAASFVTPDNINLAVDGATQAKDALVKDALNIISAIANGVAK